MHHRTRLSRLTPALTLLLLVLAAVPALASADLQTIDFEAGPVLGAPVEHAGDVTFVQGEGFRPYRTEVGARAHSGTVVGDVGQCIAESSEAGACEFFDAGTTARLARSADRVTVFAGMFNGENPAETATLVARRANGSVVATSGAVAIDATGFDAELSVSSAAGDIASFTVEASGGDLGIDDVKVSFASGAAPDFGVAASGEVLALVQGQQQTIPVSIPRLNGSNGRVRLSISGLPAGVTGSFAPNPVAAAGESTTLTLNVASNAPDTEFAASDATITAEPLDGAEVGPGQRTTTLSMRVAAALDLELRGFKAGQTAPGTEVSVPLPQCVPAEFPLKIRRDIGLKGDVALSLSPADGGELRAGFAAEILPSATVAAGDGNLVAERTLRFAAGAGSDYGSGTLPLKLTATAPGGVSKVLYLKLTPEFPRATIATSTPGSGLGDTPRFGKPGTTVHVHGNGFCPKMSLQIGNPRAKVVPDTVSAHELTFTVPRLATSGPVTVVPDDLPSYWTGDSLSVDSVRNHDGFRFGNPLFGSLSLEEFVEAFGDDEVFVSVNPCWPFGDCRISTGLVDPVAAVEWKLMGRRSTAHCFGVDLAVERFKEGKVPYARFQSTEPPRAAGDVFHLGAVNGRHTPSPQLESFLDAEQVIQFSSEYRKVYDDRAKSFAAQVKTLREEFARNREPIVTLQSDDDGGHALLAYDLEETPTETKIYAYDPNRPFLEREDDAHGEVEHQALVEEGVIHLNKATHRWSFNLTPSEPWEGKEDGSLFVAPRSSTPDNPSLPELGRLAEWAFGVSAGVKVSAGPGAELMPTSEPQPEAGGTGERSGVWSAERPGAPLDVSFRGTGAGSYEGAYSSHGFVAAVTGVKTARGVDDSVHGDGEALTFHSGEDRSLHLDLARKGKGSNRLAASVATEASAGGSDKTGFGAGDALVYSHQGDATVVKLTLTSVHANGGPSTFVSGPIAVAGGDRLSLRRAGKGTGRMLLTVRDAKGHVHTRTLRNRLRSDRHLRIGKPRLRGHKLSVQLGLTGKRTRAVFGATALVMHGGRVVAKRSRALRADSGHGVVSWRLPKGLSGRGYHVVVQAQALLGGGRNSSVSGTVSAHRASRLPRA
jgi:hypothetical protein